MSAKEIQTTPVAEVDIGTFHLTIVGKDIDVAVRLLTESGFQLPSRPYKDFENGWNEYILITAQNQACILSLGKLSFNEALKNGRNLIVQSRGVFTDIDQAQIAYDALVKEETRYGMD